MDMLWFQKSRNMELLEQELSNPDSPRPPPLPPRPPAIARPTLPVPSMPSASSAPSLTTTSRASASQSASATGEGSSTQEEEEPWYVATPHRSAAAVGSQLRGVVVRRPGLGRSNTYNEHLDTRPPALPPPRKLSLPFVELGSLEVAARPPSPVAPERNLPVQSLDSPDRSRSANRSPRSNDHSPRSSPHPPNSSRPWTVPNEKETVNMELICTSRSHVTSKH